MDLLRRTSQKILPSFNINKHSISFLFITTRHASTITGGGSAAKVRPVDRPIRRKGPRLGPNQRALENHGLKGMLSNATRESNDFNETRTVADSIANGPKEFEIKASGNNPAFEYAKSQTKIKDNLSESNLESFVPTFSKFNLRNDVIQGLESLQISQPTVIQMKAIPAILKGKDVLCAAQTGTGKTLAYLIPIINKFKSDEENGVLTRFRRPQICIVSPYRELAVQILHVVKSMSYHAPMRSLGCIGGEKDRIMHRGLKENPIDVIVGTPGTILDMVQRGKILFTDLRYLVFDEADTMFDSSFKAMTKTFFSIMKNKETRSENKVTARYVLAAATLPQQGVLNAIKAQIPKIDVVTATLHHVLPHVTHKFIKTSQPEKPNLLVELLNSRIATDKKVIVFANSSSTCNWLSNYLEENNISTLKLSGKVAPDARHRIFKELVKSEACILICTDIASRGLDFPDLFYVINYDCPLNTTDYIHRVGRTGRARAEYMGIPEVYTLLSRNWEVTLARKIKYAAEKKRAIEDVNVIKRDSNTVDVLSKEC
eukprot:Seg3545.2 transcript_id=Seg3545.2/GoldUCD/mRNA.D3Y31 product="DEAD-box ATP-dependent RNA helicase 39" protein_id=Seg3545.2/GoldUCD/D3Y31